MFPLPRVEASTPQPWAILSHAFSVPDVLDTGTCPIAKSRQPAPCQLPSSLHPIIPIVRRFGEASKRHRFMNKLLLVIIAFLLPPLAVGLKAGIGNPLFLNIILTLLVYVPGLFHALWVVLKD